VRDAIRDISQIADSGAELDALAKMSPERQAAVVGRVQSGDAASIRAAAAHKPLTDKAEAGVQKELKPNPPATEPSPSPTTAQKWARSLANQMSVPELREVRDAIDKILADAEYAGSAAVH
jgi:hypothetical protein